MYTFLLLILSNVFQYTLFIRVPLFCLGCYWLKATHLRIGLYFSFFTIQRCETNIQLQAEKGGVSFEKPKEESFLAFSRLHKSLCSYTRKINLLFSIYIKRLTCGSSYLIVLDNTNHATLRTYSKKQFGINKYKTMKRKFTKCISYNKTTGTPLYLLWLR